MAKQKRWIFSEIDELKCQSLAKEFSLSPRIAQVLLARGLKTSQEIQAFLKPSLNQLFHPYEIPGLEKAVQRILLAIEKQEKICIYGDYDVDGCCSTALLCEFFSKIGYPVESYIPHRVKEGYSLNEKALKVISQRSVDLIITVDNGIRSVEMAALVYDLGMELIITDHHELGDELPRAQALVNPKIDSSSPGQELAGVGVAFFLAIGLRLALREKKYFAETPEPRLRDFLDLVALATIADLVPLVKTNRVLTKLGLQEMSLRRRKGLNALLEVSKVTDQVNTYDVGFKIGPRINAVGRLSQADKGLHLLLSHDIKESQELAKELDEENQKRREIEKTMTSSIKEKIQLEPNLTQNKSLLFYDENFHVGVVGIVASRLVEEYHLPSIVFCEEGEFLRGSARSIPGLDLIAALDECSSLMEKYGGHKMAAGLTLKKENYSEFSKQFDQAVCLQLTEEEDFLPQLKVDLSVGIDELNLNFMKELDLLEPFGQANAKPVFALEGVRFSALKVVGDKHLKGQVQGIGKKIDFIWFNEGPEMIRVRSCNKTVFYPDLNVWQGRTSLQLKVKDIH